MACDLAMKNDRPAIYCVVDSIDGADDDLRDWLIIHVLLYSDRIETVTTESTKSNSFHLLSCRFAKQNDRERTRGRRWRPVTVPELHCYLGLRILMGPTQKARVAFYWARNPGIAQNIFPDTMPRERFEQISRNLHFGDNEEVQAEDGRLWKVIVLFGERFRAVFVPNENISIDETLWKFRGREWARFGVKV